MPTTAQNRHPHYNQPQAEKCINMQSVSTLPSKEKNGNGTGVGADGTQIRRQDGTGEKVASDPMKASLRIGANTLGVHLDN